MDEKTAIVCIQGEFMSLQDLLDESLSLIDDEDTPLSTLRMYESCIEEELKRCDSCWSKNSPFVTQGDELDKLSRSYRSVARGARKSLVTVRHTIAHVSASNAVLKTVPAPPATPTLPPPKLPALKIPEFSGNEEEWIAFWDIFDSLVNSRTDIANVVKFATLRNSLKDNAFKAIEGLPVTNANYAVAVKTLQDRYANEENLKRKLMSKLNHLSSPCHNHEELTTFKLEYEKLILQLKNLKIDTNAMSPMISNLICEKLPSETRKIIANKYNSMSLEITQISEGIRYVCDLMEFCDEVDSSKKSKSNVDENKGNSPNVHNRVDRSKTKGNSYSSNTFYSNASHSKANVQNYNLSHNRSSHSSSNVSPKCVFCSRSHASHYCKTYDSVDKRRERIRDLRLCFACLEGGHVFSDCKSKPRCKVCDGPHFPMVCRRTSNSINPASPNLHVNNTVVNQPQVEKGSIKSNSQSSSGNNDKGASPVVHSASTSVNSTQTKPEQESAMISTALPTATVTVSGNGQRSKERALFDIGSQRSFIASELSSRLNLPTLSKVSLKVKPFGKEAFEVESRIVRVVVRLGGTRTVIRAVEYDYVNSHISSPGLAKIAVFLSNKGVKLADLDLKSDEVGNIGLVIGVDYYGRFIKGQRLCSGIDILNSSGGALIYGNLPSWAIGDVQVSQIQASHVSVGKIEVSEVPIDSCCEVKKLWDLESAGIHMSETTPEERDTVDSFNKGVKYVHGKYEVSLPFKNENRPPVNYRIAIGQLKSLASRFERDRSLYDHYENILQEYVNLGFIEQLPDHAPIKGHYLPHHPVMKNSETTPIRIVYNASSKVRGELSLNDCLQTGPSLTAKLFETLVNFRVNPIAVVADISKAFLRIGLSPDCRDYCRFLWVKDPSDPNSLITYRFCVICFGATSSPFILQQTLLHHFSLHENPIASSLMDNFYVDNFVKTYANVETLFEEYPGINEILSQANMPLQEWASNDSQFNEYVKMKRGSVNVLGLDWNLENDSLSLKEVDCTFDGPLTKRKVLSLVSRMFDPLGLLSPIQIRGKIFVQSLWQNHYGWDESLSKPLCDEFLKICHCFSDVNKICIPRFVLCPAACNLHVFCDASNKAYGAAAYVVNHEEGVSHLLLSKAKVAPNPKLTIPRLELTALTLGAKLAFSLINNLSLKLISCTLWSDNSSAICWVRNNNSKLPFVRNRVKEIKDTNFPVKYVPTKENPADILTRGDRTVSKLENEELWWNGPEWLISKVYPDQKLPVININELLAEPIVVQPPPPLIDITKFSRLRMIERFVRYILMFICKCRKLENFKLNERMTLVYLEQEQHFASTKAFLNNTISSRTPKDVLNFCVQLDLFIDQSGLIRSKGRMKNSTLNYDTQCPVLLPPKSHLTWLIVQHLHRSNHHCGVNTTLVLLRESFWLPKARQVIKKIISKCVLCQIVTKDRMGLPPPPPLPPERVRYNRPFRCVGVDYTGAINVIDHESGTEEKVFVCLFTCTTSRAVHFELTHTMSSSDFLLAFRRFVGFHSVPSLIISDNGRNFVGFNNFLKEIKDEEEVNNYLESHSIEWKFIVPRAPWTGGFYERLVGVLKGCLAKALYRKRVSFEELRTLLVEFQAIVNARPLTYLSQERESEALTPSLLLYGRNICISPPLNDLMLSDPDFVGPSELREQYAYLSSVISKFENSFQKDYLVSLRERHYNSRGEPSLNLKVGDIVMVDLEDHIGKGHRSLLSMGKITKLLPTSDNVVRTVEVFVSGKYYVRPIAKLVHLELDEPTEGLETTSLQKETIVTAFPPRKKRGAAMRCDANRKLLVEEGSL